MKFTGVMIQLLVLTILSVTVFAQNSEFDIDRAIIGEERHFDPFYVKETSELKALVDAGKVGNDEELLVLEKNDQHLAILTRHMAYHHVAQGTLENEPWLLTF